MTLTELHYLIALDRERHFGRAAEYCDVSQPTLSVALKRLEQELEVTLFERSRSEVRPTPIGERIIRQAEKILAEVDGLEALARQGQNQLSGALRLGVIYTVGPYLLPHLVPQLQDTAPEMPLVIEENYTHVLARQLRQNELDAIVICLPFDESGLQTRPLYDEPFVVGLPSEHAWAKRKSIEPADLSQESLLMLGSGNCFRDQVLEACPGCRESEVSGRAGSSLETIRHMVASGLGITVLPQSSVTENPAEQVRLVTRPFSGKPPSRRVALAWRKSFPRPQAIQTLHQAVLDCDISGVRKLPADTAVKQT